MGAEEESCPQSSRRLFFSNRLHTFNNIASCNVRILPSRHPRPQKTCMRQSLPGLGRRKQDPRQTGKYVSRCFPSLLLVIVVVCFFFVVEI